MQPVLTPQQALERLRRTGRTVNSVARELGVKPWIVRGVLNGKFKGNWGEAHRVAVVLGTKDGVTVPADAPLCDALHAADRSMATTSATNRGGAPRLNKKAA
jgi:gp16 family phage-associated protein